MSDHISLWEATAEEIKAGNRAALATVSRHRGSLPMASNAKMLVTSAGRKRGTVGGGCVEAEVIEQAIATLDSRQPSFARHSLNADVAGDLGLSCGGTVEFFIEPVPVSNEMEVLCRAVASGVASRSVISVVTGLDWSQGPRKMARVGRDEFNVGLDWQVPNGLISGRPSNGATAYLLEDPACFVEHVPRSPRLIVYGAGHVGRKIAVLAANVGFHVVVVDDRADFANANRIPEADEIVVGDFSQTIKAFDFEVDDYVLATTRGHSYDATVVAHVAETDAGYVGMLGSRRKKSVLWKALEKAGVSRVALDRVRCPIGMDIGADGPDEIAVSVVAELIDVRRKRDSAD